jgi:DNA-binding CsgD family transcriptional regulator
MVFTGLILAVISILLGTICIFISLMLYKKFKSIIYMSYIIANFPVILLILLLGIILFSREFGISFIIRNNLFFLNLAYAVRSILIFGMPFIMHSLYKSKNAAIKNILAGIYSVTVFSIFILNSAVFSSAFLKNIIAYLLPSLSFAPVSIYLAVNFFIYYKNIKKEKYFNINIVLLILMSLYFIMLVLQIVFFIIEKPFNPAQIDILSTSFIYLIWNIAFLRFLTSFINMRPVPVPGINLEDLQYFNKYNLTNREKEVVLLLLEGFNVNSIGKKFFISPHTANTHIKNIYSKLNIQNRLQLLNIFKKHI